MQKGRMLRVAAGALPPHSSCSKGLAHRRGEGSGTGQAGPWGAPGATTACHGSGVCEWVCVCVRSVLIMSHPLLCEQTADFSLLLLIPGGEDSLNY